MVAIITGGSLGLERSSSRLRGAQGQLGSAAMGRAGEGVYVNAATGNLILSNQDESLIGRGPDAIINRTYNSFGGWDGDNNDSWRAGVYRRVQITGTPGDASSVVTRTDWDGSQTTYSWNANWFGTGSGAYVTTDGAGAHDTLTLSGITWTWTDGDTLATETYDNAIGGRITASKDRENNTTTYTYASTDPAALLTRITTAAGEYVILKYGTGSASNRLDSIETYSPGPTVTTTRVYYDYDASGRLSRVTVNLNPADNSKTTGGIYYTDYTYDTVSGYVSSITQSDGSKLEFEYTLVSSSYRVSKVSQTVSGSGGSAVKRVTTLSYDTTNRITTITDPASQVTTLRYDTANNLTSITLPAPTPGAVAPTITYGYAANGDLTSVVSAGNTVTYGYDSHGNRTLELDSLGNKVTRRFNSRNQLLAETRFTGVDSDGVGGTEPAGAMTTRYVYANADTSVDDDAGTDATWGRLLYVVSAEGFVTAYGYDGFGQRTSALDYATASYNVASLLPTNNVPAAGFASWLATLTNKSGFQRTETTYDFRGNIASTLTGPKLLADGTFDTTVERTRTVYVYSPHGELLSRQTNSVGTTNQFPNPNAASQWGTPSNSSLQMTTFPSVGGTAAQLTATATGQLSFVNASTVLAASAGETFTFTLDLMAGSSTSTTASLGLLGGSSLWGDSTDSSAFIVSGPAGATVTQTLGGLFIAGLSTTQVTRITVTRRFTRNENVQARVYVGSGSSGSTNGYSVYVGNPVLIRDTRVAAETYVYDGLSRVTSTIDMNGATTSFAFNDAATTSTVTLASALVQTSTYDLAGELISYAESGAGVSTATTSYKYDQLGRLRMTTSPGGLRHYFLYDADGRRIADIDADGSLTEYRYDAASRLTSTTAYAANLSTAQLSSLVDGSGNPAEVTLASIRPAADNSNDRWSWTWYDTSGRTIRTIDGTGAVQTYSYDGASQRIGSTQYANRMGASQLTDLKNATSAANLLTGNVNDPAYWSPSAASLGQSGTIGGNPALLLTATTNGQLAIAGASLHQIPVTAGTTLSFTIQLKAGSTTVASVEILGSVSSTGANADSSVVISGPAGVTATRIAGGRFLISGLTSTETTVTVTRTFNQTENSVARVFVDSGSAGATAGHTIYFGNAAVTGQAAAIPALPTADAVNDRVTRSFYDKDGRLTGALDAEGYLSEILYDMAGRVTGTVAYSGLTAAGQRASGTLADLRTSVVPNFAKDNRTWSLYDASGKLAATIDGEGGLTRYYSTTGGYYQQDSGQKITIASLPAAPTLADLPAVTTGSVVRTVYGTRTMYGDVISRTETLTGSSTTTTTYAYDSMRRVVSTTTQSGGPAPRVYGQRYDLRGRLIGELTPEGSVQLASLGASPTGAQVDAVYAQYGTTYAYNDDNLLISRSGPTPATGAREKTLYYYNSDGGLAYEIDALGQVIGYRYNAFGQVTDTTVYGTVILAATLASMTGGMLTAGVTTTLTGIVNAALDTSIHNDFFTDGTVSQTLDPLGKASGFTYNAFGEVRTTTAPRAGTTTLETTFSYDRRGLLTQKKVDSATGGKAIVTGYGYDAFGRLWTLTDPNLNTTTTTWDRAGRLDKTTNALAKDTKNTYDARGNLVAVTDALNNVTRYIYDKANRLIVTIDALGDVVRTTYDADGRVSATRSYFNRISNVSSLALELPETQAMPAEDATADEVTTYTYDQNGRLRTSADIYGNTTTYTYDMRDNVVAVEDPAHNVTRSVYDADGRKTATIDSAGGVTRFTYDAAGNVKSSRSCYKAISLTSQPLEMSDTVLTNAITTANGGSSTNALDRVTNYAYDLAGRVTSRTEVLNGTTSYATAYTYNAAGDLVAVQDAMAGITRYVYDSAGRKVATIDALGTVSRSTYDQAGNVIVSRDYFTRIMVPAGPAGDPLNLEVTEAELVGYVATNTADHVTRYAYDVLGQARYAMDALGHVVETVYDAVGNAIRTIAYDGKVDTTQSDSTYTAAWFATAITNGNLAAASGTRITRFVYDQTGAVAYSIDATGQITAFVNDSEGHLIQRTEYAALYTPSDDPSKTTMASWLIGKTSAANDRTSYAWYDADGRQAYTQDAEGYVTRNEYDARGLVSKQTRYSVAVPSISGTPVTTATSLTTLNNYFNPLVDNDVRVTRFSYDAAGRLKETIDADGYRTELTLNALGQIEASVTGVTANAQGVLDFSKASTTTYGYDALGRMVSQTQGSGTTVASVTRYFYDALGRLGAIVDGDNYLATYGYDALGQRTSETRYAGAIAQAISSTTLISDLQSWAGSGVSTGIVYDAFGRVKNSTDARGTVTQNTYDALDELKSQTVQAATATGTSFTGTDVTVSYDYDNFGNVSKTTDARGNDSFAWYDKLDRVVRQLDAERYLTETGYTRGGKIASVTRHQVTSNVWASNDNAALWTLNGVSQQAATDIDGNKAFTIKVATTGTAGYTASSYSPALQAGDVVTFSFWIKAGGANFANFGIIDGASQWGSNTSAAIAIGGGTLTQSNGIWTISGLSSTQATLVTLTRTVTTAGSIMSARVYAGALGSTALATDSVVVSDPVLASGAVTKFQYDRRDQLIASTDALGNTENYTVNGFGERSSLKSKLGAYTSYTYNKRGLLKTQSLKTAETGGTLISTLTCDYDERGNRTLESTWATGVVNAPATAYTYDALDRVTSSSGVFVSTVHLDVSGSTPNITAENALPLTNYTYDHRGNVTLVSQMVDRVGSAQTFADTNSWYDSLGRKTDEISPAGTWTHWDYDANGNVAAVTIYDTAVTPGANHSLPTAPAGYRRTSFVYDRLDRQKSSTGASVLTGEYDPATGVFTRTTAAVTTSVTYDAAGNVVLQTDGRGGNIYSYFDRTGHKVAQVDAERYLTVWSYDAEGNVLSETRFADKIGAQAQEPVDTTTSVTTLRGYVTAGLTDRTTLFSYDRNGNRLTEKRLNVAVGAVDAAGVLTTNDTATSQITYTYNGMGQVWTKQEANGDLTTYDYDSLGRLILETNASFRDYLWVSGGDNAAMRTSYAYDGLNNLISTRAKIAIADNSADRVTTYEYNALGLLTKTTDANNNVHNYSYDAAGRMVLDSYTRVDSLGASVEEAKVTGYDVAGRVTLQTFARKSGSTWLFTDAARKVLPADSTPYYAGGNYYDAVRIRYNAFGEVTGRGVTAGPTVAAVYQETFEYDNGGRLWRSNSGDGVQRVYLYDAVGNQTLVLESAGADLSTGLQSDLAALITVSGSLAGTGTINNLNATTTVTAYDKRGQAIKISEADRQLSGASTGTLTNIFHTKTYNAFGEVASESDGRGNVTLFEYNTMGRLVKKTLPTAAYIGADGNAIADTTNKEEYRYDVSGRLVAVIDANGNVTRRTLLAGTGHGDDEALVLKEFHADNTVVETRYSVFGDAVRVIDELNQAESRGYDKLGQLVSVQHRGGLIDTYGYDLLGQRVYNYNSLLTATYTARTDYDAQGRVVLTTDMGGNATTYGYVWLNSYVTTGMASYGGWTRTTKSWGQTATEAQDYFGRTIDKIDYGNHNYDFTYDKGGRLVLRTNNAATQDPRTMGGERIAYSYLNTGALGSAESGHIDRTNLTGIADVFTYSYDADGRRKSEKFVTDSYTYGYLVSAQHQLASSDYDTLGRLTHYEDFGDIASTGQAATVSVNYAYDKVGNVRKTEATYRDAVTGITGPARAFWYTYDQLNRVRISMGTLNTTTHTIEVGAGVDIAYDAAGRRTMTTRLTTHSVDLVRDDDYGGTVIVGHVDATTQRYEKYTYDADGQLDTVRSGDGSVDQYSGEVYYADPNNLALRADYTRDTMGRVTNYVEYDTYGSTITYSNAVTFGTGQRILLEISRTEQRLKTTGSGLDSIVTTSDYQLDTTNSAWNGSTHGVYNGAFVGTVTHTKSVINSDTSKASETEYDYVWWDGQVQSHIGTFRTPDDDKPPITNFSRDASGNVYALVRNGGNSATQVSFVNNLDGQIIYRREWSTTNSDVSFEYHYIFSGAVRGVTGNNGPSESFDYAGAVDGRNTTPTAPFRWGYAQSYANFDQNYEAVLPTNQDGGTYTVNTGDTLQTIAAGLWGDASLWYKLADANGLNGSETLVQGQVLNVPGGVTTIHNSSSTFKPYDPNEAMGVTSPAAPKPKPNKCGAFGQILLIVIAIAITAIIKVPVTQFFTGLFSGIGLGATASVIAGTAVGFAATGAVASTVSQGVGLLTGIQQGGFNWNQVGISAVSAMIGGGDTGSGNFIENFVSGMITGAISNAATQGIARVTGLQKNFDWTAVAAAGLSGGITSNIGLGGIDGSIARGAAAAVANAATRSLINGEDFGDNMIAALPSIIASTIGNGLIEQLGINSQWDPQEQIRKLRATEAAARAQRPLSGAELATASQSPPAETDGYEGGPAPTHEAVVAMLGDGAIATAPFNAAEVLSKLPLVDLAGINISATIKKLPGGNENPATDTTQSGDGPAAAANATVVSGTHLKPRMHGDGLKGDRIGVRVVDKPDWHLGKNGNMGYWYQKGEQDAYWYDSGKSFEQFTLEGILNYGGELVDLSGDVANGLGDAVVSLKDLTVEVADEYLGGGPASDPIRGGVQAAFRMLAPQTLRESQQRAIVRHETMQRNLRELTLLKAVTPFAYVADQAIVHDNLHPAARMFGTLFGPQLVFSAAGLGIQAVNATRAGSFSSGAAAAEGLVSIRLGEVGPIRGLTPSYVRAAGSGVEGTTDLSLNGSRLTLNTQSLAAEEVPQLTAAQLRSAPGVATASGDLAPASGAWLDAGVPTPIPGQVADALAGQQFNSFGDLRSAIWEHIGNNAELNGGFTPRNVRLMQDGYAPFAPTEYLNESGAFGQSFNLHHIDPIANGGPVYDLSNLHIVSPKVHYNIHY